MFLVYESHYEPYMMIMEALISFETSVLTRPTRRNIPEYAILHSHRRENVRPYIYEVYSVTLHR
jgi:hypothetical protein